MPRLSPIFQLARGPSLLSRPTHPNLPLGTIPQTRSILPTVRPIQPQASSHRSLSFLTASFRASSPFSSFASFSPSTSTLSRLSSLIPIPAAISGTAGGAGPLTQIRTIAYGTNYQPSQRKRKRKHGFLSRARGGRLGKKVLARRWLKGRRSLSH